MTEPMTPVPPHSGDDTYDLTDHALYQLAERRQRWLGDPLAAITLTASLIDQAERMLPEQVAEARANGATWHRHRHRPGHQPRTSRTPLQPRLPHRRQQMALRLRLNQPQTTQSNQPPSPGGRIFHPAKRGQFSNGVDRRACCISGVPGLG